MNVEGEKLIVFLFGKRNSQWLVNIAENPRLIAKMFHKLIGIELHCSKKNGTDINENDIREKFKKKKKTNSFTEEHMLHIHAIAGHLTRSIIGPLFLGPY
jgi:hypothetical protein